jgi:hypothetical protein
LIREAHTRLQEGPPEVLEALDLLLVWLDANGLAGYDPYDILGSPGFARITADSSPRLVRRVLLSARHRYPRATRRLFGVKPAVNAKGVGLLLSSHLRLESLGYETHTDADECARWLAANPSPGYPGAAWGYPFDWYTREFIPAFTPSAVVTATCGQALLDHAEFRDDETSREAARGAAQFLAEGLNRSTDEEGDICLSYTPLDHFQVHNASLMAAEYLLRAARAFSVPEWYELAASCMRFTVADQLEDGSFEYWAPAQRISTQIDNYHTGFVLRSLYAFADAGFENAGRALDACWTHYRDTMLSPDGRPRNEPGADTPLDIHSCAESVLCPAVLSARFPEALDRAEAAARWTITNMRNADGTFIHGVWGHHRRTMTYLRWGQAWMLRAFAELLLAEEHASTAAEGMSAE